MLRRLSETVIFLKTLDSCGRYPIPSLALLYIGSLVMGFSSSLTPPSVGLMKPTIM